MTWLLLNIPLMLLFFALWTAIPLWLVLRRPDGAPTVAAASALTRLPARERQDADCRRAA